MTDGQSTAPDWPGCKGDHLHHLYLTSDCMTSSAPQTYTTSQMHKLFKLFLETIHFVIFQLFLMTNHSGLFKLFFITNQYLLMLFKIFFVRTISSVSCSIFFITNHYVPLKPFFIINI